MSKIIAVVNQKGGTGKTCTAVHLVYWLANQRRKSSVQLIDADSQGSSSAWIKAINQQIPVYPMTNPDRLAEELPDLDSLANFTIIDGAGNLTESTRVILSYTDLALVPCQPTALDIHSSGAILRLIRQAQKFRGERLQAAVFLSRAIPNTRLKSEAVETLQGIENALLLKTVIHQRQAIADAFGQDATVWDLGQSAKKAAKEYDSLFKEVMKL